MRVHVVDGTFELFRAHFSKRPDHKTPDGRDGKATLGVAQRFFADAVGGWDRVRQPDPIVS